MFWLPGNLCKGVRWDLTSPSRNFQWILLFSLQHTQALQPACFQNSLGACRVDWLLASLSFLCAFTKLWFLLVYFICCHFSVLFPSSRSVLKSSSLVMHLPVLFMAVNLYFKKFPIILRESREGEEVNMSTQLTVFNWKSSCDIVFI